MTASAPDLYVMMHSTLVMVVTVVGAPAEAAMAVVTR
jgi:hypothetical protein